MEAGEGPGVERILCVLSVPDVAERKLKDGREEEEEDDPTAILAAPAIISPDISRGPVLNDGSACLACLAWLGLIRLHSCPGSWMSR